MTKLNDRMAEVMEWHKERIASHTSNPMFWVDEQGNKVMICSAWNPTEDMNQAMTCAIKCLRGHTRYSEGILKTWKERTGFAHGYYLITPDGKWLGGYVKETPELAICEAIAKAIGGKN